MYQLHGRDMVSCPNNKERGIYEKRRKTTLWRIGERYATMQRLDKRRATNIEKSVFCGVPKQWTQHEVGAHESYVFVCN
jgi:hypothetical protein